MAEFPALPLWTDAYLGDTQHLTNEEHGVYLRLLMFAWRSPDCSLPADDKRLAIMVGMTLGKWRKVKPVVMAFWTKEGSVWRQKRLTKQRQASEAFREQKSAAGKASARAKSRKTKDQASTGVGTDVATEGGTEGGTEPPTGGQLPVTISNSSSSGSGREDKSSPPPPQAAADPDSSSKEEEAVGVLGEVARAVGYPEGAKPPKAWSSPEARRLVRSWLDSGLSGDEIVDRARRSRQVHPEPPTSPKALASFMLVPAAGQDPPASAAVKDAPREDQLRFWAEKINGPGYLPQSAIKPNVARELLDAGLVTREKLRERGIAA